MLSEPADATVRLDGVTAGKTPLRLQWKPGTSPLVELQLPGHGPAQIVLGDRHGGKMLNITLEPLP